MGTMGRHEETPVVQPLPGFGHLVNLMAMTYDRGGRAYRDKIWEFISRTGRGTGEEGRGHTTRPPSLVPRPPSLALR